MKRIILAVLVALCAVGNAAAQQTTGSIQGRITDAQGSAVPGVTVTGKNTSTGFTRSEVSDAEGVFRLIGLPVTAVRPRRARMCACEQIASQCNTLLLQRTRIAASRRPASFSPSRMPASTRHRSQVPPQSIGTTTLAAPTPTATAMVHW